MIGPPRWVEPYLDIPFVEEGDSHSGCHCWGLVRLVFREQRQIELPLFAGIAARDLRGVVSAIRRGVAVESDWMTVAGQWQPFDVILLTGDVPDGSGKTRTLRCHVGVAVTPVHLLHIEIGTLSHCIVKTEPAIRERLAGAYRYIGNPRHSQQ